MNKIYMNKLDLWRSTWIGLIAASTNYYDFSGSHIAHHNECICVINAKSKYSTFQLIKNYYHYCIHNVRQSFVEKKNLVNFVVVVVTTATALNGKWVHISKFYKASHNLNNEKYTSNYYCICSVYLWFTIYRFSTKNCFVVWERKIVHLKFS